MGRVERRETAHMELVGASVVSAEYPDTLMLPSTIHDRARAAVEQTGQDCRERTLNFHFAWQSWRNVLTLRGADPLVNADTSTEVRVNRVALATSLFFRPHVFLHTHPDIRTDLFQSLEEKATLRAIAARTAEPVAPSAGSINPNEAFMLPSIGDTLAFTSNVGGTVGNMVASVGGNFLAVRRDVQDCSVFGDLGGVRARRTRGVRSKLEQANVAIETERVVGEAARDRVLSAIASATQEFFVCYFSPDPESPTLTRVA